MQSFQPPTPIHLKTFSKRIRLHRKLLTSHHSFLFAISFGMPGKFLLLCFPRLDFASHTSSDQGKLLMNKEQFFDESEKTEAEWIKSAFLLSETRKWEILISHRTNGIIPE